MFHYGRPPINNIKRDISNIEVLKKNIISYPEPISDLQIKLNDLVYQDDFEISLLRFVHIIFEKDNEINLQHLKNIIGETYLTNNLYIFLANNKKINKYISLRQRLEWCNLLNNNMNFSYKFNSKYKLSPIIYNIIKFFEIFFPVLLDRELNIQNKLDKILKIIDTNNKISCKYFVTGYFTSDKIYEENLIKIFINGNNIYDWKLYQYYENLNNDKGKLITGYSELKYSYYLDKYT